MSERDRGEEAPAQGNWRVTAQPYSAAAAAPAGSQAAPASSPDAPAKAGGRPLIATLICVGVLALSLAGQSSTPMVPGSGPAFSGGFVIGGAVFGAILWSIAFAITIRKASTGWKAGSLILLAVLGGLVALARVTSAGAAAPVPVVRIGE
jgi:hypothetical protein